MMRVAIRGQIVVLALVLAIASAGTVLCEMDCVAGGHIDSATTMSDSASGVATSHCDGEQTDSPRHDVPAPHGSSDGNTKHSGGHSHPRIVATATASIQILPQRTFSNLAVISDLFSSCTFVGVEGNLRNNNSSPPINSPAVFSTGVLRI
jgi:hypothetical protein